MPQPNGFGVVRLDMTKNANNPWNQLASFTGIQASYVCNQEYQLHDITIVYNRLLLSLIIVIYDI